MSRWPDADREQGSVMLALMLILILTGLGALLLSTTVLQSKSVQHDQKFTDVLPAADAAINQGLFMLNHGQSAQLLTPQQPLALLGGTATLSATQVTNVHAPVSYLLTSTATHGVQRTVQAEAYQSSRFRLSAFAVQSFVMNGGNTSSSYNSDSGTLTATGNGQVGSDGSVTLNGASADGVDLYNWTADPNTSRCVSNGSTVCSTSLTTYGQNLDISSAAATNFISSALAACQAQGPLSAYSTSGTSPVTLPSGTWCASSVTLNTDIVVTQPTTIYVSGNVITSHHLNINYSSTTVPKPAMLQIYMLGNTYDMANHTTIAAAIYAPLATCNGGAQSVVYGSLVCNVISNVGGWQFHYDDALATIGAGDFRIRHYREG